MLNFLQECGNQRRPWEANRFVKPHGVGVGKRTSAGVGLDSGSLVFPLGPTVIFWYDGRPEST